MKRCIAVLEAINKGMDFIAGLSLLVIMLLTSIDVVVRYLGHPVQGSYDMVSLMGVFLIGFALPRTLWQSGNISVDIVTAKIKKGKTFLELLTRIMAIALFALITWNLVEMGGSFFQTKDGTLTIGIPFYPVAYALALCTFVQCCAIALQMARIFSTGGSHE